MIRALALLLLLLLVAAPAWAATDIVLIIADDLGWPYLGVMGHPSVRTPNLDRLAREGLLFTDAQVTYPACEQSLRALDRGRHNRDVDRLDHSQILLPTALKARGYFTIEQGKWRDGVSAPAVFDRAVPPIAGAGRADRTMTALFAALDAAPRPYFLWWGPAIPHAPHTAPAPFPSFYPPGTDLGAIPLEYGPNGTRSYLAMVSWLDARVGELLEYLAVRGRLDDTLIVFLSDNGGGIRQSKGSFKEAGIRTPLILRGPGVVPRVSQDLAASIDLAPTFIQIAGGTPPVLPDARSLVPAMAGVEGHRALWFANLHPGDDYAVRDVAGRKVYTSKTGLVTRVSNLAADPYEQRDWRGTAFGTQAVADLLPALNAWRLRQ